MANPFRNQQLRRVYQTMLDLARDPTSDLYHGGKRRTGASHRCAFWEGYDGRVIGTGPNRSVSTIRGTLSHACWAAGRDFAKETKSKGEPT